MVDRARRRGRSRRDPDRDQRLAGPGRRRRAGRSARAASRPPARNSPTRGTRRAPACSACPRCPTSTEVTGAGQRHHRDAHLVRGEPTAGGSTCSARAPSTTSTRPPTAQFALGLRRQPPHPGRRRPAGPAAPGRRRHPARAGPPGAQPRRRRPARAAGRQAGGRRPGGRPAAGPGRRRTPRSPMVDVWADPATGLPLQVEVTAKGGLRPVFVTRFLEIHFERAGRRPCSTPPVLQRRRLGFQRHRGAGHPQRAQPAPARHRCPPRWPARRGARRCRASPSADVYGTGLSAVRRGRAARPVRRAGLPADRHLRADRPGARRGAPRSSPTGLLSVLVVRAGNRTWLAAGLVQPALLERVAADLATEAPDDPDAAS